jgi:hypothetical protein
MSGQFSNFFKTILQSNEVQACPKELESERCKEAKTRIKVQYDSNSYPKTLVFSLTWQS